MSFKVRVADNFHQRDDADTYEMGPYPTFEIAEAEAKRIVDECLASLHEPAMSAEDLYRRYSGFGDDPYVVAEDGTVRFQGWRYARERCEALCSRDEGSGEA